MYTNLNIYLNVLPSNKNGSTREPSKILTRVKVRELQGQTGAGCGCLESYNYVRFLGDTDHDDGFNLIQPSLIQQLKSILNQYPDDGQILKVLLAATKNYLLMIIKEKSVGLPFALKSLKRKWGIFSPEARGVRNPELQH